MGRSTASKTSGGGGLPLGRRLLWWVGGALVLFYAVQGGEYSTTGLLRQRAKARTLRAEIAALHHAVDSLKTLEHAIATDPAVQERIAREDFGMVSGHKERIYRFAAPDSVSRR